MKGVNQKHSCALLKKVEMCRPTLPCASLVSGMPSAASLFIQPPPSRGLSTGNARRRRRGSSSATSISGPFYSNK
jgi:hypothetical protein